MDKKKATNNEEQCSHSPCGSQKALAVVYKAKLRFITSMISNMRILPVILLFWLFMTGFIGHCLYNCHYQFKSFYILLLIMDTLIFLDIMCSFKYISSMMKWKYMSIKYIEYKLGVDCTSIHNYFANCCNTTKKQQECNTERTDHSNNECNTHEHKGKCCKYYPIWLKCAIVFFLVYGSAIWLSCNMFEGIFNATVM